MEEGNNLVELTIKRLQADGHEVVIPVQTMNEYFSQKVPPEVRTKRLARLNELGLKPAPRGKLSDRIDVREANLERKILSEHDILIDNPKRGKVNDVLVAAEAHAGGGEVWSFDRKFLQIEGKTAVGPGKNVTTSLAKGGLGVKVAPESWLTRSPKKPPGGPDS
jgi:hypothetical protein